MRNAYKSLIVSALVGPLVWLVVGCGGGAEDKKEAPKPAPTTGAPAAPKTTAPTTEPAKGGEAKAAVEGWGSVKGQIVYGGANIPEPRVLITEGDVKAAKDPHCAKHGIKSEELVVNPDNKGIRWAAVYLRGSPPAVAAALKEPKEKKVIFDQEGCHFIPHVLAMRADQELVVKSSDPIRHNTKMNPIRNQPFNQMLDPNDKGRDVKLVSEGRPFSVECNIHPWMKAWILVLNHPYQAVTASDGSFEIKDLPAGKRQLTVWHEKLAPQGKTVDVEIKPGETTDAGTITLQEGGVARLAP